MAKFQQKKNTKSLWHTWPVLILLATFLVFFVFGIFELMNKVTITSKHKNIAVSSVAELEARKAELVSDIDKLNTIEGKEKVFRENFGLAKAGEGVVIIVEDESIKKDIKEEKKGFFGFLKKMFR